MGEDKQDRYATTLSRSKGVELINVGIRFSGVN